MPGTMSELTTCPVCHCGVLSIPLHNEIDHPERMEPWQHATRASSDGWTGD
jgi:hypothetical protein